MTGAGWAAGDLAVCVKEGWVGLYTNATPDAAPALRGIYRVASLREYGFLVFGEFGPKVEA